MNSSSTDLEVQEIFDQGGQNRIYLAKDRKSGLKYITKTAQTEKNKQYAVYLHEEASIFDKIKGIPGVV